MTNSGMDDDYVPTHARPVLPHCVMPLTSASPFAYLITKIWDKMHNGLTAHVPIEIYLRHNLGAKVEHTWAAIVNVDFESLMDSEGRIAVGDLGTPTNHLRSSVEMMYKQGKTD